MITYMTEDGKEFSTEAEALEHDKELQLIKEKIEPLFDAAREIKAICSTYDTSKQCADGCPFYDTTVNECLFYNNFGEPSVPEKWKI